MIMARSLVDSAGVRPAQAMFLSELGESDRGRSMADCRALCEAIHEGLDVRCEIESVAVQGLGDTILLGDGDRLDGLAVCHVGPGTEAGSGTCYVKFAAVRPGPSAGEGLKRLLDSCAALGVARGATRLLAGVNTARHEAYAALLSLGFRTEFQGVTMHRPNVPGYSRPGVFILDDWR
jgi:hypothetical protein